MNLYPNASIVVTQDRHFDLLRYAASSGKAIAIRELEDVGSIKQVSFHPPSRRRDGNGVVGKNVEFAGYEVAWGVHEFKAILVTVRTTPEYNNTSLIAIVV